MNQKTIITIFLLIGIFAIGLSRYFWEDTSDNFSDRAAQPNDTLVPELVRDPETNTRGEGKTVTCYDDPKYFAIYRDLADAVGSDILVKYKSSPTQVISCTYSKEVGDFELNNAYAEYFLAIADHFLITDFGTAPGPRGLTVYDLDSQTKYFSDLYLYSVKSEKGEIIYWTPSKIEPSKANCSEYWDYEMGAKIAVRVSLNLETLVKKELGEFQCYPLQ